MRKAVQSVASVVIIVYLGVLILAWAFAETLIFQPPPASYRDSDRIIKLTSNDGARIAAVHLPNPASRYTILFIHGNAEDLGHLLPFLEQLHGLGFSVLAYDYRGYGTSSGKPSEESAYRDADAAYEFLLSSGVPADRIIAHGRSLGGAVAIDLASRRPVAGLIVESSFVTAYRVMTGIPLFPFDRFRSVAKIGRVRRPVLVIHGTRDEVISFGHGRRLHAAANDPKRSVWIEGAGHNDLFDVAGRRYGQALRELAALIDKEGRTGP
jgi:fermentation-respiration switch protein FrsA (DUF1100 family)